MGTNKRVCVRVIIKLKKLIIMETNKELSFGEKAVGLSFNPSGDEKVNKIKELYAEIIDLCNKEREEMERPSEKGRLLSVAITEAQGAQMWTVKAITWK